MGEEKAAGSRQTRLKITWKIQPQISRAVGIVKDIIPSRGGIISFPNAESLKFPTFTRSEQAILEEDSKACFLGNSGFAFDFIIRGDSPGNRLLKVEKERFRRIFPLN